MPVVVPIDVKPFSAEFSSTVPMKDEWTRGAGRALDESARAIAAIATARRGGTEVAAESPGVRANSNNTRAGVAAARPNAESSLAWSAQQNRAGASGSISNAERNTRNPDAPVPNFDRNRPFRELDPSLRAAQAERARLARERGNADNWERKFKREDRDGEAI